MLIKTILAILIILIILCVVDLSTPRTRVYNAVITVEQQYLHGGIDTVSYGLSVSDSTRFSIHAINGSLSIVPNTTGRIIGLHNSIFKARILNVNF